MMLTTTDQKEWCLCRSCAFDATAALSSIDFQVFQINWIGKQMAWGFEPELCSSFALVLW